MMVAVAVSAALLAGAEPGLTEAQAVERAVQASPALGALGHRVDETRALEDVAGRWNNPELRLQNLRSDRLVDPGLHRATYPDHPLQGARLGVRWEPPRPGVASAREAEAAAAASRAEADRILARRATAARARGLHATLRALDLALESARAERSERERIRHVLERRVVEQHAATALDLSAAALDALEAAEVVERLEIERGRAEADLTALLGLPAGAAPALSGEGASRCEPGDQDLLARAAASDPRVAAARAGAAAADAEVSRRWLSFVPWPTYVQASYVFRGDADPAYWTFQLGFELPLLDWRRAERRAFAARRARHEAEGRAEVAALERDLREAQARVAEKAARARRFRDAAAALEEASAAYGASAPAAGTVQAGQLRARVLAARRAQAEAELDCVLERIDVDRLSGAEAGTPAGPALPGKT